MMRWMIILPIIMVIGGFGVLPTNASFLTPPMIQRPLSSIDTPNATRGIVLADKDDLQSHRYLAQRKSSSPPGESHTGRASSSQPGGVTESGRDSGRPLDPSQLPSHHEVDSTSNERPKESVVTPQKRVDPLEGERKSQPATRKRGGVVR